MKINEIIVEHIGKVKGGYRLYSHKGKNLGTFPSKAGAEKHEREVQYFKHAGEGVEEAKATKTRLDPKCWKGKKIGNPKTKVKGGVRVNNCVPIEESQTFDHLTSKRLKSILLAPQANARTLEWAMDFTEDALRADYDDEEDDFKSNKTAILDKDDDEVLDEGKMVDPHTDIVNQCIKKGYTTTKQLTPADWDEIGKKFGQQGLKFAVTCGFKTPNGKDTGKEMGEPLDEGIVDHLTNKKLRRILVSGPKNLDEVVWAMDFTDDALRADYDDEMIDSRTFDARNNAFKQAQEAFHDEDGEFNPDADIHATLAHLKQFWLV